MRYSVFFGVILVLLSHKALASDDRSCPLTPGLVEANLNSLRQAAKSSGVYEQRYLQFLDRMAEEIFVNDEFKALRHARPQEIKVVAESDGTVVSTNLGERTESRRSNKPDSPKCSFFFIRVAIDSSVESGKARTIVAAIDKCTEFFGTKYHDKNEVIPSPFCGPDR